jgi:peptide/nickel transport system substrate-binding protein
MSWKIRAKQRLSFFNLFKKKKFSQKNDDMQLVYKLSPHKIPNRKQLQHISKFLNPKENLVLKICLLLLVINVVYLSVVFFKKHLQYTPIIGGDYSEALVGYPKAINPIYAANRDVDADLSRLIYSSLFVYDKNNVLTNDLAESYIISDDGKEYTIKIKNNVNFHNNDKLTADDILFTYDLIKNSDYHSPFRSAFTNVEVEKIDDYTIKFDLAEPYAPFLELLNFGILPKNIWKNVNPQSILLFEANLKPIGSGPYKFKSLIKNKDGDLKEYRLTLNDNYYGAKPYIKNINFKFFIDYSEAINALNDNQVNGLSYLPYSENNSLLAKNSLSIHQLIKPQIVSLFFNKEKIKSFNDKTIRVALAQSINKQQLVDNVFKGAYQVANSPIPSSNFSFNNNLKLYSYDPGASADILRGKAMTVTLSVIDRPENVAVANEVKNYWEMAGVKVTVKTVPVEQVADVIKNRDFEVLLYGESVGGDPDVYAFWHSSQISGKGLNLASYSNPEVDKLLAEARVTNNVNDRVAKYQKFQELLNNDLPVIFLYSPAYTYVQDSKLKGFDSLVIIDPADRFSGISSWYLKTKSKLIW